MKSLIFLISLFLFSLKLFSFNSDTIRKIKFSGFVKADAIFDSRQNVSAREQFVLLYPKNIDLDQNGQDINSKPNYNQYATSTRIIISYDSLKINKSILSTNIETDFTGSSELTNSALRLRHAYIKYDYLHFGILAGQYWHPLVAAEIFPDMISLNLGNPFKSAMRTPQVRLSYTNKNNSTTLTFSTQRDNTSISLLGASSIYLQNQVLPSINLQNIYQKNSFLIGSSIDFKRLLMRNQNNFYQKIDEYNSSYGATIFSKFKFSGFQFKTQLTYGQNLYEHTLLGGVGVSNIDTINDKYTYSNISQISYWFQASKKINKFNYLLFVGISKNLGSNKNLLENKIYSRGSDIDYLFRIAPQIIYFAGKLLIVSETELTTAAYGKIDNKMKAINSKKVSNIRENISFIYLF